MCTGCVYLSCGSAHCYCQALPREVELSPNQRPCSLYRGKQQAENNETEKRDDEND